ncbi:MAG: lipopolysaccharide heptosyltransferase II [bacterium]|nr:lipopolysaccharide heptosyltransferase II [bacterium]
MPNADKNAPRPRKVLLIRFGAMGDVILATPAIRAAAAACATGRVDFLTKSAYRPLVRNHPSVERVLAFGGGEGAGFWSLARTVRAGRYDAVIDLQNSLRSRFLSLLSGAKKRGTVKIGRWKRFQLVRCRRDRYGEILAVPLKYLAAASVIGARDDGKGPDLFVDPDQTAAVDRRLESAGLAGGRRLVALAPGAGRATKRWPAERFGEVASAFISRGYAAAFIGGEADKPACAEALKNAAGPAADLSGVFPLAGTAGVISRCSLLVTNDTGLMHMAAALSVPCVAVFGPTTRHFGFFPFRAPSVVVEKPLACRPCSYHGTDRCPKGHFRCMLDIGAGEVLSAAERVLIPEN